jgi:probable HAF family extracellular repeat protein
VRESTTADDEEGFSWGYSGPISGLGDLHGLPTEARAVNAAGEIVGTASTGPFGSAPSRAFLWKAPYGMIDLGLPLGENSEAWGINRHGVVAGVAGPWASRHVVLWVTRVE